MIRKTTTSIAAAVLATTSLAAAIEAGAQVLPRVQTPLPRPLERPLDRLSETPDRTRERIEDADETLTDAVEIDAEAASRNLPDAGRSLQGAAAAADDVAGQAGAAVQAVDGIATQAVDDVIDIVERTLRAFELGASPDGWPVEAQTVVALLDDDQLDRLEAAGLDIVSQRRLASLDATLVTFREPTPAPIDVTLGTVRGTWPDAVADYNHVYRLQQDAAPGGAEGVPAGSLPGNGKEAPDAALRIGMIDSAVDATHFTLEGLTVVGRSFVDHEGTEPVTHGTAVASLIKNASGSDAVIHSASVFFQTPNYAPGATTESLILALDWLTSESVDVINMSLAGPANALLEQAVASLGDAGPVIVAAVGNNGPSGEPLYPAAYAGVVGVTAVDRDRRIYRYANRGDYVDFAALGVDVKVADTRGGGWRIESGTSMASPEVAVIVAIMQKQENLGPAEVVSRLSVGAEDLGQAGYDPVFGFGFVARPPVLASRR